jgi:hypothetical protein
MPMEFVEDEREFIERHGSVYVSVPLEALGLKGGASDVYARLFADGALMVCDVKGEWHRYEPPPDPAKRLASRQKFAQLRTERAERAFNRLKAAVTLTGPPFRCDAPENKEFGPWSGDAKTDLIRLRDLAQGRRELLTAIQNEIDLLEENVRKAAARQRLKELQEQTAAAEAAQAVELNSINL